MIFNIKTKIKTLHFFLFFLIGVFSVPEGEKEHNKINFQPLFRAVKDPALHSTIPLELEKIYNLNMESVNEELSLS